MKMKRYGFILWLVGLMVLTALPLAANPARAADPGTWAATGSMSQTRFEHTATLLPNGKVLVAGGSYYDGKYHYHSSVEVYDPVTGAWSATGSMSKARKLHTATLLPNGKVLVAGGVKTPTPARKCTTP